MNLMNTNILVGRMCFLALLPTTSQSLDMLATLKSGFKSIYMSYNGIELSIKDSDKF